jgi:hypothetical protein
MKTRLMIIEQALPLRNTQVRITNSGVILHTDQDGKIELDLAHGAHEIEVTASGISHRLTLELSPTPPPILIVDIAKQAAQGTQDSIPGTQRLASLISERQLLQDRIDATGGRYTIEGVLGRGGMGVVLKAHDNLLQRTVAIKILSEELQDNKEAQRLFLAEARSLARLSHPNLVAIHDVTTAQDIVLMVFEFVEGTTLDRIIADEPLFEEIGLQVAIQAAEALAYLHGEGIIHRDIKPSNLMLTTGGDIKLIDFGLARSLDDIMAKGTRVRGTPSYMAPEQIMGTELSAGVDVYQLGVTYFECFTGRVPFEEGNLFMAHLSQPAPSVATLHPTLHPALIQIIDRCLAKGPESRFADAGALLHALLQIQLHHRQRLPSLPFQSPNTGTMRIPRTIPTPAPTIPGSPAIPSGFAAATPTATTEAPKPRAGRTTMTRQRAELRTVAIIFLVALVTSLAIVVYLVATRPPSPAAPPTVATISAPSPTPTPPPIAPKPVEPEPVELAPALDAGERALTDARQSALDAAQELAQDAAPEKPDARRPPRHDPKPAKPEPVEPVATKPEPVEPKPEPVLPKPVEPKPVEPVATKPKPEPVEPPSTAPPKTPTPTPTPPDPITPKPKKPPRPPRGF